MNEVERLLIWMKRQNLSKRDLAAEIGMSYDGVYQILSWRKRISPGFKLRFIERYGSLVASEIFDRPEISQLEPA